MVDNLKKIGLLLGRKENGNISLIERWPLIVTHGIQEVGKGFFSMVHTLVDLTARIN